MDMYRYLLVLLFSSLLFSCDSKTSDPGGIIVDVQSYRGEQLPLDQRGVISESEVAPYRQNGKYASVLKECALIQYENACTLEKLPIIAQEHSPIDVEAIMQRVLVTHDWMGLRFEQLLHRMPQDMRAMFGPVATIVIGSDVRPSTYSPGLAKIRIDPWYLWMSVDEKQTVSNEDDYRAAFQQKIQFKGLWRYAKNNAYTSYSYSLDDEKERPINHLETSFASLMFHELGHANDYMPPSAILELDPQQRFWENAASMQDKWIHNQLYDEPSLLESESFLYGLANVRFTDAEATEFQAAVLADQAGEMMSQGGKTNFYSYASKQEDVANLLEVAMMKYHYGVDMDIGFANRPSLEEITCNDYKVAWGVRNRIGSDLVWPRAEFVASKILPASGISNFFANTGNEVSLDIGKGWCNSVVRDDSSVMRNAKRAPDRKTQSAEANFDIREFERRLPDVVFDK